MKIPGARQPLQACHPERSDGAMFRAPLMILIFAALACGLPVPELSSVIEAPPESTPTIQIDVSITTAPLNAIIPPTLASGAASTVTTEVEFPYINPSLGEMPSHSKYLLEDYPLVTSVHQPGVLVFNASEYANYSELTQMIVEGLRDLSATPGAPLPEALYSGPLTAQVAPIEFRNGRGVRYLTQSGQAPEPIHNEGLFYFFQGVTTDGQYYVSAIFPTSNAFLVSNADPASPLPVDGIPFDFENFETLPEYYAAMTEKLDSAAPATFSPSLAILDAFVESFLIRP